jgi:serine/threonine protein kinase
MNCDAPFFTTEYCQSNLRTEISKGPIPLRRALQLFLQIASALKYAHRRSIYHQGLKPENVLIDKRGNVKVGDFDQMSIAPQGQSQKNVISLHNIAYLAPEQRNLGKADSRTDIYALGVLLCEMIMGAVPFSDPTQFEKEMPGLPKVLYTIIQKMASPLPSDRYETVDALFADIYAHPEILDTEIQEKVVVVQTNPKDIWEERLMTQVPLRKKPTFATS